VDPAKSTHHRPPPSADQGDARKNTTTGTSAESAEDPNDADHQTTTITTTLHPEGPWMKSAIGHGRVLGLTALRDKNTPWRWKLQMPARQVDFCDLALTTRVTRDDGKLNHDLREAWRWSQVQTWKRSTRNDADDCRDADITLERIAALRGAPRDIHALAIMTGATVSPARFAVMQAGHDGNPRDEEGRIAPCGPCGVTSSFNHWMWHCPATRVAEITPNDPLLQRLGWPRPGHLSDDLITLRAMAALRGESARARHTQFGETHDGSDF
jgi:hypothetical protein